jgi:uncharacterized protein DUF5818
MKVVRMVFVGLAALAGVQAYAEDAKTYVGVITDTMCVADHKPMNVAPDAKCVRECVSDGKTFQYALLNGKAVYRLSDQETPAKFAGHTVRVTGILYTKTNILKVLRIEKTN